MTDMPEETDEAIAARVQAGDTEAFGALVERYEAKLLRYGRRFLNSPEDIEDLVQDAFIRAYEHMKGFDTNQRFSPWMYRIAHNTFVNRLRQKHRDPLPLPDLDTLTWHAYEDPHESEHDRTLMKKTVQEGLERLTPAYREALILHYLEDLPYKEIADVLRIPLGTVGVRLARARTALKKQLPDSATFAL